MSGDVCPSCGVPVTPGYVRCPKCRKPLPRHVARPSAGGLGGTAVETKRFPLGIVLLVAGIGLWLFVSYVVLPAFKDYMRPVNHARDAAEQAVAPQPGTTAPQPVAPTPEPQAGPAPQAAAGPSPQVLASALDRSLKRAHLWSTVEVVGDHVDVRSSSCSDAAMRPALDVAAPQFKAAGLTRLRCLEQSGTVVFQRDL
jgi:hypothetical protein